ncbi:MAG: GIY-YIG nuclease family protein [Ignavibacteriae bacterium]|nr:GIY-YIG nuclease family protein [Ignavibacteriota bacterium]
MQKQINSGIYFLEIKILRKCCIEIKKFGRISFEKGFYYYVGSAQRNLKQRILRHHRKIKKLHWHVDFITANENSKIENIFTFPNNLKKEECFFVNFLETEFQLVHKIKNFGNSDCKNCTSHLLFSKNKIDYNHLFSRYQSTVLFIPSSNEIV